MASLFLCQLHDRKIGFLMDLIILAVLLYFSPENHVIIL